MVNSKTRKSESAHSMYVLCRADIFLEGKLVQDLHRTLKQQFGGGPFLEQDGLFLFFNSKTGPGACFIVIQLPPA